GRGLPCIIYFSPGRLQGKSGVTGRAVKKRLVPRDPQPRGVRLYVDEFAAAVSSWRTPHVRVQAEE
ncbi:MAG: hypothetical protein M3P51_03460, partial [Chloroflexota bacterium]|nr:hypothetical protein [Chloroflexota bacterium]